MLRWPILLPLLVVATLPFRVRLHVAGGQAVNLLVPLYVVIGAGVLATVVATAARARPGCGKLPQAARAGAGPGDLPLRAADDLLGGRRLRRPQRRLLPDPVRDPLLACSRRRPGTAACSTAPSCVLVAEGADPGGDRHRPVRGRAHLLERQAGGVERLPLLLPGQLALLGSEHLRPLPGAGDPARRRRRCSGPPAGGWRSAWPGALAVVFAGLLFAFSQTSFIALFVGLAVLAALRWSVRWAAIATPLALGAVVRRRALRGRGLVRSSTRTITEGHSSLVRAGSSSRATGRCTATARRRSRRPSPRPRTCRRATRRSPTPSRSRSRPSRGSSASPAIWRCSRRPSGRVFAECARSPGTGRAASGRWRRETGSS